MTEKKVALVILDGWGHGAHNKSNAIYNAETPFVDSLYENYPNSQLMTHGEHVGLPKSQMGNSEVGHLNIGAGRIIFQQLERINKECNNNLIAKNKNLLKAFNYVNQYNKALHLIGLVSDGGIHSHQNHLYKLCELANKMKVKNVFVHVFTDGRDTDPKSGTNFLRQLEKNLFGAKIASICGRYYAMDRDNRWKRIKIAYDLLTQGKGEKSKNLIESIEKSYDSGITDEFIKPIVLVNDDGKPITKIKSKDAVICFNFRTDRCRQITEVLSQRDLDEFKMQKLDLHFSTMTNYNPSFSNINVLYEKEVLKNTLGEVLELNNKHQVRIAETEKYPHVTFFLSGGREEKFNFEKRIMVDSPKVATYDLLPEMSSEELTLKTIQEFKNKKADFICINFANPDMVGHTGNYKSVVKAIESVDCCLKKVVETGTKNGYVFVVIADHGNAEYILNSDGSPNTAHTINPVPCFIINTEHKKVNDGILADIAPTILNLMGIEIPNEMKGKILTQ